MHIQILDNPNDLNVIRDDISMQDAASMIDSLSGRQGLGAYIIGQCHANARRHGADRERAYVQCNRDSPFHVTYGRRGFIVRVVR